MNLQRGLQRLTAVTSLLLFCVGAVLALGKWSRDLARWDRARAQPIGPPVVLIPKYSLMRFPRGTEPSEMLAALDGAWTLAADQYLMDWDPDACNASDRPKPPIDFYEILTPDQARPGCSVSPAADVPISYVLEREWKPKKRSSLLSREQALQGEAARTLLPDTAEAIAEARRKAAFPWRASPPSPRHGWMLALGVLAAGLGPWVIFYSGLWIVRGFRS